jgi:Phosphotransferase system, mannose/fructose-specific component IIA
MKGVLLISHGEMAKGMYQTSQLFLQNEPQYDYLALQAADSPDEFEEKLINKVYTLDTGDGVIIMADLLAGTPANRALKLAGEKITLIVGMNLPVLLSVLSNRDGNMDMEEEAQAGRDGLKIWKKEKDNHTSDDNFLD